MAKRVGDSNPSEPVGRCHLDPAWYNEDAQKRRTRPSLPDARWNEHVNLWCPRSSRGRNACKRSGCCAKLSVLEELD